MAAECGIVCVSYVWERRLIRVAVVPRKRRDRLDMSCGVRFEQNRPCGRAGGVAAMEPRRAAIRQRVVGRVVVEGVPWGSMGLHCRGGLIAARYVWA